MVSEAKGRRPKTAAPPPRPSQDPLLAGDLSTNTRPGPFPLSLRKVEGFFGERLREILGRSTQAKQADTPGEAWHVAAVLLPLMRCPSEGDSSGTLSPETVTNFDEPLPPRRPLTAAENDMANKFSTRSASPGLTPSMVRAQSKPAAALDLSVGGIEGCLPRLGCSPLPG